MFLCTLTIAYQYWSTTPQKIDPTVPVAKSCRLPGLVVWGHSKLSLCHGCLFHIAMQPGSGEIQSMDGIVSFLAVPADFMCNIH